MLLAFLPMSTPPLQSSSRPQGEPLRPEWCRDLPRPQYKTLKRITLHDDWFEVYEIREGVYALYEPHQFEEVISYLIVGNRHALLLDTGLGIGKISEVVKELTPVPVVVLNSHTHFDHTGGNAEFSEILGRDTPFTRTSAKGQANEYSRDALAPERICGHLPKHVSIGEFSIRPFHITQFVKDNEQIDLGGRTLTVLFTPGHTPDSISLFDRDHGLLFTGDTYYPGPIYLFTPETDFQEFAKSVRRLADLMPDVRLLLPGHNVPLADPASLLRLKDAVQQVEAGGLKPVVTQGRREFKFDGFSLLLAPR